MSFYLVIAGVQWCFVMQCVVRWVLEASRRGFERTIGGKDTRETSAATARVVSRVLSVRLVVVAVMMISVLCWCYFFRML